MVKCSSGDKVALLGQVTNFMYTYSVGQNFEAVIISDGASDGSGGNDGIIIGLSVDTDQQLRDRNISWYEESDKFTIEILATDENNNTEVYGLIDNITRTDTFRLIVVASKC